MENKAKIMLLLGLFGLSSQAGAAGKGNQEGTNSSAKKKKERRRFSLFGNSSTIISSNGEEEASPLMQLTNAIRAQEHRTMEKILKKNLSIVNHINSSGLFPLIYAAGKNDPESLRILISFGAQVNAKDAFGQTALHKEAKHANIETLKVLLDRKALPNIQDNQERTPLHIATSYKLPEEIITYLIDQGCSNEIRDNQGRRPSDIARVKYGDSRPLVARHIEEYYKQKEQKILADLLLAIASQEGDTIADIISRNPSLVHAQDNTSGMTPLIRAASSQNSQVLSMLLAKNVDPNVQDKLGNTALHKAAKHGDEIMVNSLLIHQASNDIQNNQNKRPSDLATLHGFEDLAATMETSRRASQ